MRQVPIKVGNWKNLKNRLKLLLAAAIIVSSVFGPAFYVSRSRGSATGPTPDPTLVVDICNNASTYHCANGQRVFSVTSYAWGATSDVYFAADSVGFTFVCLSAAGLGTSDFMLTVKGIDLATANGITFTGVNVVDNVKSPTGKAFEFSHFLSECAFSIVADSTSELANGGAQSVTNGVNTLAITNIAGPTNQGIGFQSIRAVIAFASTQEDE